METRLATVADAEPIAEIYNQGIADRTATFETRPRTADEVRGHQHCSACKPRTDMPGERDS